MLATSRGTLRRLVASGDLPKVRIGGIVRYRHSDVEALVERYAAENEDGPLDTGRPQSSGMAPRHGQD